VRQSKLSPAQAAAARGAAAAPGAAARVSGNAGGGGGAATGAGGGAAVGGAGNAAAAAASGATLSGGAVGAAAALSRAAVPSARSGIGGGGSAASSVKWAPPVDLATGVVVQSAGPSAGPAAGASGGGAAPSATSTALSGGGVTPPSATSNTLSGSGGGEGVVANATCVICLSDVQDNSTGLDGCSHTFCHSCIGRWCRVSNAFCPTCRAPITELRPSSGDPEPVERPSGPAPTHSMQTATLLDFRRSEDEERERMRQEYDAGIVNGEVTRFLSAPRSERALAREMTRAALQPSMPPPPIPPPLVPPPPMPQSASTSAPSPFRFIALASAPASSPSTSTHAAAASPQLPAPARNAQSSSRDEAAREQLTAMLHDVAPKRTPATAPNASGANPANARPEGTGLPSPLAQPLFSPSPATSQSSVGQSANGSAEGLSAHERGGGGDGGGGGGEDPNHSNVDSDVDSQEGLEVALNNDEIPEELAREALEALAPVACNAPSAAEQSDWFAGAASPGGSGDVSWQHRGGADAEDSDQSEDGDTGAEHETGLDRDDSPVQLISRYQHDVEPMQHGNPLDFGRAGPNPSAMRSVAEPDASMPSDLSPSSSGDDAAQPMEASEATGTEGDQKVRDIEEAFRRQCSLANVQYNFNRRFHNIGFRRGPDEHTQNRKEAVEMLCGLERHVIANHEESLRILLEDEDSGVIMAVRRAFCKLGMVNLERTITGGLPLLPDEAAVATKDAPMKRSQASSGNLGEEDDSASQVSTWSEWRDLVNPHPRTRRLMNPTPPMHTL
jgi:hypothetical protein